MRNDTSFFDTRSTGELVGRSEYIVMIPTRLWWMFLLWRLSGDVQIVQKAITSNITNLLRSGGERTRLIYLRSKSSWLVSWFQQFPQEWPLVQSEWWFTLHHNWPLFHYWCIIIKVVAVLILQNRSCLAVQSLLLLSADSWRRNNLRWSEICRICLLEHVHLSGSRHTGTFDCKSRRGLFEYQTCTAGSGILHAMRFLWCVFQFVREDYEIDKYKELVDLSRCFHRSHFDLHLLPAIILQGSID